MLIKFDFSSKTGILVVKFAFATANLKIETLRMRRRFARVLAISNIIIKFPYNARSDWLKQRTLPEYKGQLNDIKLAFKFLLRNFDKFDPN